MFSKLSGSYSSLKNQRTANDFIIEAKLVVKITFKKLLIFAGLDNVCILSNQFYIHQHPDLHSSIAYPFEGVPYLIAPE